MELHTIIENIETCAGVNGYKLTNNVERIAKAKLRFFGEEWWRCPCYPPDDIEHGCGSVACAKDIEEQGKCHCRLFERG